jgi:hypothetical protein
MKSNNDSEQEREEKLEREGSNLFLTLYDNFTYDPITEKREYPDAWQRHIT